jgi:glycosyltransferase involved in cell wall biosynthesis
MNQYLLNCPPGLVLGKYLPFIPKMSRPRNWFNAALSSLYFRSTFKRLSPSIVHETYYSTVKLASANTKTILTVYDMIHEKFASLFRHGDRTAFVKASAIKRADQVICISESTRNDLLETLDIHPGKVSVVHLASSFTLDHNVAPKICTKKKPYIIYVGDRGGEYKNFQSLLDAYACSKRLMIDFKILCFGGGSFSSKEKKLIQQIGLSPDNIEQISGDDSVLAFCYRNAAAFVYPSLYEGFGIPLLEAMNCLCPVVCSNTSSFPEVAGDAAEYFDPYNVDSIVHALETVLYSTGRSQELIELGKKRSCRFSWDICAEKTADIYRALI